MVLRQPFPLPFAFTSFCLLAEGQHAGRCVLIPQGCQVSQNHRDQKRPLRSWSQTIKPAPLSAPVCPQGAAKVPPLSISLLFFSCKNGGAMALYLAEMSTGWESWPAPKVPLPFPCPCRPAKLLNEISWVLSSRAPGLLFPMHTPRAEPEASEHHTGGEKACAGKPPLVPAWAATPDPACPLSPPQPRCCSLLGSTSFLTRVPAFQQGLSSSSGT